MKRLFAHIGFSMLITFAAVFYFGFCFALALCAAAFVIIFLSFFKKFSAHKAAMLTVSVAAVISCLYFFAYSSLFFEPASEKYDGSTVEVEAVLKSEPYVSYGNYCYEMHTEKIDGKRENVKILLKTVNQLDIDYGDTVYCSVVLTKCENNYHISRGYLYEAESGEYFLSYKAHKAESKDIGYLPVFLRDKMCRAVSTLITGDRGSLCNALALGDKYGLPRDIYQSFTKTGLSFFIVVSGLHMSIVVYCVLFLFSGLSKRRLANAVRCGLSVIFVLLFMAITGFTSSVVRSGIMTVITLAGSAIRRRADPINSLGFSAMVLTAANPNIVGDVGLLYSFASVWGILVIYPRLSGWINSRLSKVRRCPQFIVRACGYVLDMFAVSLSAVVCVTPISLGNFGTCNPLVIILSAIISPVAGVLLVLTLFCSVIWYAPIVGFFAYPAAFAAYYLAGFVLWVVNSAVNIPMAEIVVSQDFAAVWLVFSAVVFAFAFISRRRKKLVTLAAVFSYMVLALGICFNALAAGNDLSLDVYDSGNGATAVLNCRKNRAVLSCDGDGRHTAEVINRLKTYCGNVGTLVVPSANRYDNKYAEEILTEFDVDSVLLYYRYTTDEGIWRLANECDNYREITDGNTVRLNLGAGVYDLVIAGENHCWQYVYNDNMRILIAPSKGSAEELPEQYRSADVLIISSKIKKLGLLEYESAVWASTEQVPLRLHNAISTDSNTVNIDMAQ